MRRLFFKTFLLLTLSALCLQVPYAPASAAGPSGLENIGSVGHINWTSQKAVASGVGVPMAGAVNQAQARASAARAARVDARRNLLEVIKKVRIDSKTRVENFMAVSDVVVTRIQGVLQWSALEEEKFLQDGTCRVVMSVPLTGNLSKEILSLPQTPIIHPPAIPDARLKRMEARISALEQQLSSLRRELATGFLEGARERDAALAGRLSDMGERLNALESAKAAKDEKPALKPVLPAKELPYTGLVVDARAIGFKPCLKPKILSQEKVLYPGDAVFISTASPG
ncbi:MAG: hypothetical protein SVS15_09000, partial [Thermodesulfobacteriota bacterium]|nr:hypothetical protein [Thermodesulfobacteriota bacterium]